MTTLISPTEAAGLPPPGAPVPASVPLPSQAAAPRWRSEELLAGTDEALISHGDQVYRLRRTGTGKLILTK
jgi:hemin uptake protein HemP